MVFYNKRKKEHEGALAAPEQPKLLWHRSLLGKVTSFLVIGVVLSYAVGALVGWLMVERSSKEQWERQAEMNAQVASSTIRTIYTFIAVDTDERGQITRIISNRPLGDDQSVLDTGFNPIDVLGLASAQTKNEMWLFQNDSQAGKFMSSAAASSGDSGELLDLPETVAKDRFFTGLASIGDVRHFVAYLPVITSDGKLLGAVVTSIGEADLLLQNQKQLARNSLILLVLILFLTGCVVTLLMRRLFRPVPDLIDALARIAKDDTGAVTPFQNRSDEIGRFAVAIETLREAVVEREHLRQVRELAKQMEHLAHHDSLTGLPNRAFFNKQLETAISTLADKSVRFNVLLIDLDRFKAINDALGHAYGDALLIAATERISLLLGPRDVPARLGGDEFVILQHVSRNPVLEASKLAKAVVNCISTPFTILGQEVSIGASVGIANAPSQGNTIGDLMRSADIALYCAKSSGRGTYRFFKDGMVMPGTNRYALERDLEVALDRNEFQLHYQPIFSFGHDEPAGYEALLRWNHPELGLVPPGDFIPLAEETGQIVRIGEWVLRQACSDAMRLPQDTTMSVNVSVAQLQQNTLLDTIKSALAQSGLPSSRLEIELTESVLLAGETANDMVISIHELGVGIALDDFGTGYSTLSYLLKLPIGKIKIDRSFVNEMASRNENRLIVAGIVRLAESLGIKTTAEGIETATQLSLLGIAGCSFAQGFHLGRPVPFSQIKSVIYDAPDKRTSFLGAF